MKGRPRPPRVYYPVDEFPVESRKDIVDMCFIMLALDKDKAKELNGIGLNNRDSITFHDTLDRFKDAEEAFDSLRTWQVEKMACKLWLYRKQLAKQGIKEDELYNLLTIRIPRY